MKNKKIVLIISGSIAAYKSLDLIRRFKENDAHMRCILTKGGAQFITPLSVSSLSGEKVYDDLWSLTDEAEMGHIRLAREADLILIAPASADIIAKYTHGLANDLASTCLLATDAPVMIAPAMNPVMYANQATQQNISTLQERGIHFLEPETGEMACGEEGKGRMAEVDTIISKVNSFFGPRPLEGKTALVTSGPTFEPIDPVRYIGNKSSGKQGHAIAKALSDAGANVTLISGPVGIPDPSNVKTIHIETAQEMLESYQSLPKMDIAVCAAAVSDWHITNPSDQKIKKTDDGKCPSLQFTENPDILATISNDEDARPEIVIGFAAETENLKENAAKKLDKKGCDWIIANNVGHDPSIFGGDENDVSLVSTGQKGEILYEEWDRAGKDIVAQRLVEKIIDYYK